MQAIWLILGLVSLTLGGIGIFLPLLPTVPFMLLAAFFFSKSSERLHNWLVTHPVFGPFIEDWQRNKSISKRVKIYATVSIVAVFLISLILGLKSVLVILQAIILGFALFFIWTRPAA